ncbi:MAG: hypothetical protein JOZ57_04715 [Abitibacteriaceae bacterium]|nr:hypothetical protein [Abditibacteriaceae bacterium]
MSDEVLPEFWLSETAAKAILVALVHDLDIDVLHAARQVKLHINNDLPPDCAVICNGAAGMLLERLGLQAMGVPPDYGEP